MKVYVDFLPEPKNASTKIAIDRYKAVVNRFREICDETEKILLKEYTQEQIDQAIQTATYQDCDEKN